MNNLPESAIDRLEVLADKWESHCADEQAAGDQKHRPVTIGGSATFDTSMGRRYIVCCVKGCDWKFALAGLS